MEQVLSWNLLRIFSAQAWPGKKVTEITVKLDGKTCIAEAQGAHMGKTTPKVQRPLSREWISILGAKYAQIAPVSRIEYATVAVNYLTRTARVTLYYVNEKGEKLRYHEHHNTNA